MTLPDERYRAVLWAKRFLQEVSYDLKKYPRVPGPVRREAHNILRHFPTEWEMECAAELAPSVFQQKMEPLYRAIKEYDLEKNKDK